MATVVNLNEIVPGIEGTTFKYLEQELHLRGDLPSETVFEFLALYDELIQFRAEAVELAKSDDPAAVLKVRESLNNVTEKIRERLLAAFKLSDPSLDDLPFGNQSTMVVLGEVLKAMGLAAPADPPAPPARKPPARRKKTTSSRSKRATSPQTRKR